MDTERQEEAIRELIDAMATMKQITAELCDYMYWRVESPEDKANLIQMKREVSSLYVSLPDR